MKAVLLRALTLTAVLMSPLLLLSVTNAGFTAQTASGASFAAGTWVAEPDPEPSGPATMLTWGSAGNEQLGHRSHLESYSPAAVASSGTWRSSFGSSGHSCGIQTDRSLWCWGLGDFGELGRGAGQDVPSRPQRVGADTDWDSGSVGLETTCAIKVAGSLYCWGNNAQGQLGVGSTAPWTTPAAVSAANTPNSDWRQVSVGSNFTCATKASGTLWCWGNNNNGQLGQTTNTTTASLHRVPVQVAAGVSWAWVDVGDTTAFACGLTTTGQVHCWGINTNAQLGKGTQGAATSADWSPAPVATTNTSNTGWAEVTAGGNFACARKATREVFCWGNNTGGRLGKGNSTANSANYAPAAVSSTNIANDSWASLSAGSTSACAITTSAHLYCWGSNTFGQLGKGSVSAAGVAANHSPARIGTGTDWTAVAGGPGLPAVYGSAASFCGVRGSAGAGSLSCWGDPLWGQLGRGTYPYQDTAAPVLGGGTWGQSAVGDEHACAVRADATLWCWGVNSMGQLTGSANESSTPMQIGLEASWQSVAVGSRSTCGIRAPGTLWCWGANTEGELGRGAISIPAQAGDRIVTQVGVDANWSALASGNLSYCALKTTGALYCWGANGRGQLGVGSQSGRTSPAQVGGSLSWRSVEGGPLHYCGVRTDNTLWCWGANDDGQLGTGSWSASDVPVQVGIQADWSTVTAGTAHTCARKLDGSLWCWGSSAYAQLGSAASATDQLSPIQVGTAVDWTVVAAFSDTTCGLKSTGVLWCWGDGQDGQMGLDPSNLADRKLPPTRHAGVAGVQSLAVSGGSFQRVILAVGSVAAS